jgi:hypothetical protein
MKNGLISWCGKLGGLVKNFSCTHPKPQTLQLIDICLFFPPTRWQNVFVFLSEYQMCPGRVQRGWWQTSTFWRVWLSLRNMPSQRNMYYKKCLKCCKISLHSWSYFIFIFIFVNKFLPFDYYLKHIFFGVHFFVFYKKFHPPPRWKVCGNTSKTQICHWKI